MKSDPFQLTNLAENPEYSEVKKKLADRLQKELTETADPRVIEKGHLLDEYAMQYSNI